MAGSPVDRLNPHETRQAPRARWAAHAGALFRQMAKELGRTSNGRSSIRRIRACEGSLSGFWAAVQRRAQEVEEAALAAKVQNLSPTRHHLLRARAGSLPEPS